MGLNFERAKLTAFGVAGALWTLVFFGFLSDDLRLVSLAAAYFLVFTLAVAVVRRSGVAVLAAWATSVLVIGVVLTATQDTLAADMAVGLSIGAVALGTALSGSWVAIGFLLLLAFDPTRYKPGTA